jgi:starch phosphorylase
MLEANLTFEEALEATRHNNVFTTHTSVPAGIDLFDTGLLYEYFHAYCEQAGIPFEKLVALGRQRPEDPQDNFSMAVLAIQTSSYRNAVSLLHRHVSQEMWQELWPDLPTWEVPITSVTNGVHLPSWVNGDLAALYDTYLQPDWRDRYAGDPNTWDMIDEIPNQELWEAHKRRKRRLVAFVRERGVAAAHARKAPLKEIKQLEQVLDPEAFTIGFARRFATYKRATLLFRDIERLKRIITNSKRPVQIIIAGKAHPRDIPGKTLIREIVQWSRDASLSKHVVFLEDYGIQVARELVQGVDLWLNNPRRGEEACGTSGMKAGLNGVLNLSILDGWYDEAYEQSGGWAIGDREPYSPELDDVHATSVYSMLENEILPTYYEERDGDVPVDWMKRVKQCMKHVSAQFNCQRMIQDYWTQLYEPAHRNYVQVSQNNFAYARKRNEWTGIVRHCWPNVRFLQVGPGPDPTVTSGREIPLSATLDLAGLGRDDVRVEALVGKVGPGGELEQTQVLTLDPMDQDGTVFRYGREFVPHQTGRLGYAFRVTPNHYDDPLNRPCRPLLKWGGLRAD